MTERFATRYVFFVFRWNTFLDQYKAAIDEVNGVFVGGFLTPDYMQTAPHTAKNLLCKLKHPHSQHEDVFPGPAALFCPMVDQPLLRCNKPSNNDGFWN
ncbi:hypothetical protein OUZ56_016798 [Daphnia magna]|uniref:Uncharacterized protein n=1 Tax=Daphnia magna TaxID=35525 RepID=A0ABR0ARJ6_9CRUS|nr:hypothetical protein OUZ56_016798 [Daphnia magna]